MDIFKVGTSLQNMVAFPAPDEWGYDLMDISASDAGRTEDENVTMHKNTVAQKRKLSPVWKNRDGATIARIYQAFDPENVYVQYPDAKTNTIQTRLFYCGDKSSPLRKITVNGTEYSQLSFNLIEV